mgnify:CR=1 FL=1
MSRASDWAWRRIHAEGEMAQINEERPKPSAQAWAPRLGWWCFAVSDAGLPKIVIGTNEYVVDLSNRGRLLEQARWLLDVFGESSVKKEQW